MAVTEAHGMYCIVTDKTILNLHSMPTMARAYTMLCFAESFVHAGGGHAV